MKKLIKIIFIITVLVALLILFINFYVILSAKNQIKDNYKKIENVDYILVLGAGIRNNSPSPMLKDRLDKAIELYKKNISKKIIMSGDHSSKYYNEVIVMRNYAIDCGVLEEDIIMDHSGFSTYESIYRVKQNYNAKKIIIVTQKYHLYRAVYISKKLNIKTYGISAENKKYSGNKRRKLREVFARNKDFIKCVFKPPVNLEEEDLSILET